MSIGFSSKFASLPTPYPLTLLAGTLIAETLNHPNLTLRWPNDLVAPGGKLCGILCESRWRGSEARTVIGIGINMRHSQSLPEQVSNLQDIGIELEPDKLFDSLVTAFEHTLLDLPPANRVIQRWSTWSHLHSGTEIRLSTDHLIYTVVDILPGGQLSLSRHGVSRILDEHDSSIQLIKEPHHAFGH